jgi:hypothetical protein
MKCDYKEWVNVGPRKEKLQCGENMLRTRPTVGPNKGKTIWTCPRGHTKIVG